MNLWRPAGASSNLSPSKGGQLLQKRQWAHQIRVAPTALLPPNLRTLEVRPFTPEKDRQTLHAWLSEDGWPRGSMDMGMLEGYLVALLVWPVSVSPGAWLPSIWGEKAGWRVPAKIAAPEAFDKFIGLVVGLLRDLDRGLDVPQFVPTLSPDEPVRRGPRAPGVSWAQGFLCALQHSAQGLQCRSPAARSAVAGIAGYASLVVPSAGARSVAVTNLTAAVLTLAAERSSHGPLGALETKDAKAVKHRTTKTTFINH